MTRRNEIDQDEVERKRARDLEELGLATAGIPARFWDAQLEKLPFRQCRFDAYSRAKVKQDKKTRKVSAVVTPAQQRQVLKQIIREPKGQLVVLGGELTDEGPLAAASSTLVQARQNGRQVHVVNAEYADERIPQGTNVYMVYNVLVRGSRARIEAVRDLLVRRSFAARIVVLAGCKADTEPVAFCYNRLGLKPDMVGYIESPE